MPRESLASPVPLTFRNRRGFLRILSVLKPDIFFYFFSSFRFASRAAVDESLVSPIFFCSRCFFLIGSDFRLLNQWNPKKSRNFKVDQIPKMPVIENPKEFWFSDGPASECCSKMILKNPR